eukprot:8860448-Pyramimonas_sp.AAC.1
MEIHEGIDKECVRRQRLDSALQLAKWKGWAKNGAIGGGKAARAFSEHQVASICPRGIAHDYRLPVA